MKLRSIMVPGAKAQPARVDSFGRGDTEPEWGRARPARYAVGGAKQSAKAYAGGRDGIDHFYDAVNVYTAQARKAELRFRRPDGTLVKLRKAPDDPKEVEEAPPALYELFTMPNPWMPWHELMDLMIIDLLSVGNFFAGKDAADRDGNKPAAIYRLPAQDMSIESTKQHHINKYILEGGKKPVKFDPQQVVHLRLPNPHSPYSMLGIGAVQASPQPFDIELGLVEAQRNYFAEGTVLSGVLESDRTIPEATRKKALQEFLNLHRGSRQWGKLAFLERGMRYRAIQGNAMEAGYESLSKQSRERVFAMLHTPLILAGIGIDQAQKGALDDARRFFAEDVMQPFLEALAFVLTQQLVGAWDLVAEFNYTFVPPQEQRVINADKLAALPGVKVKEVREAAGLPPLGPEFKDEATGDLIDELVLNVPGPSTESTQGVPDAVMGEDGGRPADPANRPRFEKAPTSRTSETVNGRKASPADVARRARTRAPARGRAAKSGVTAEELVSGAIFERIP